jgi:hypothetical protein
MMHPLAERRLRAAVADAVRTGGNVDAALDQYANALLLATEWDAQQWGFDPDRWMEPERVELAQRGGDCWPVEECW